MAVKDGLPPPDLPRPGLQRAAYLTHRQDRGYSGAILAGGGVAITTTQPVGKRVVNTLGGAVGRLGLQPSLDPARLLATATRATGLSDFGDPSFREGLSRLLDELDGPAKLTTIGRLAAHSRVLDLLQTRLRLVDHRRRHPEVAAQPVARPVVVLGLPRTGTTVLYGLLAANPALRAPVSWEVARPFPPPTRDQRFTDPRIAAADRQFDRFRRLAPDLDRVHPLGAMLPQECLALHALQFTSYEFVTTFPVPRYWAWLRQQDLRAAYEVERDMLQHLQSGYGGDHWILKTPSHLMWLDTLLEVFPDALVVHTHRDPTTVMASVSSLMFHFRSAVSDHVDPHEVGRDQVDAWTWALDRTIAAREHLPADRVVDVHFDETVGDPVGTVTRVYEHFGIEVTDAIAEGVRAYLADNPRDKHGRHDYRLSDFGLHVDEVSERFAAYRARFGIDT